MKFQAMGKKSEEVKPWSIALHKIALIDAIAEISIEKQDEDTLFVCLDRLTEVQMELDAIFNSLQGIPQDEFDDGAIMDQPKNKLGFSHE